ncbi:hypothetical protein CAEBREN_25874 [Caenorhabditis brenneri]|uniref:Uncharacterized protein n=1 Tax=Caenorhabditis brenneri TaxID=135651 RepID=G0N4A8_CAEBE|nr:hypothetical protein CAEBREN_25874 [Caenorhabditis brenneri]
MEMFSSYLLTIAPDCSLAERTPCRKDDLASRCFQHLTPSAPLPITQLFFSDKSALCGLLHNTILSFLKKKTLYKKWNTVWELEELRNERVKLTVKL